MSKKITAFIRGAAIVLVIIVTANAQAQWNTSLGNGHIYKDPTTGNVGIGNANPLFKLHLTLATNSDGFAIGGVQTPGFQILTNSANSGARNWAFFTNYDNWGDFVISRSSTNTGSPYGGTAAMNFQSNGNVGIGVFTPSARLHVGGGNAQFDGNVTVSGNIAARYQDVAEWVTSSSDLEPGTVVVLNLDRVNEVMPSHSAYDTAVAGVVSEQPGIILGEPGEKKEQIATTGRVRVRADASAGPIAVGDLLVTSDKVGVAMRSIAVDLSGIKMHRPGTIIGKALEPLAKGEGEILVLLSLQ